jgi:hypothetical protein
MHKGEDRQLPKLKDLYKRTLHDEKKLRDFMSALWNVQNPAVRNIWNSTPKGRCALCLNIPGQVYCLDCERRLFLFYCLALPFRLQVRSRKIAVLGIHGVKLLQENSERVKMLVLC